MNENKRCYVQSQSKGWTEPCSTIRATYQLDDRTGRLLQTGQEDLVELVQSGYSSCLDYVVDRFLESGLSRDDIAGAAGMTDNQDFLLDALEVSSDYVEMMEEARETFGLSPDLTYSQVREQLQVLLEKEKAKNNMPIEEVIENGTNETQTSQDDVQTEEQEIVS